jgi:hypothetical protein
MALAVAIFLMVVTFLSIAFVAAVFVWAARKDGEDQDALDAKLGLHRGRPRRM